MACETQDLSSLSERISRRVIISKEIGVFMVSIDNDWSALRVKIIKK